MPPLAWRAYRMLNRATMPPDQSFALLRPAGVDAVVAKAVGDWVVTRTYRGGAWVAVERQLSRLRSQCAEVDGVVALHAADVRAAFADKRPAMVLGVEGADVIGAELSGVDRLHQLGVRVLGLVHFADNAIGTICMPFWGFVAPRTARRRPKRREGLTRFGAEVVARMNELGMVIDLAHADHQTLLAACELTRKPVVATHTGARALQDFDRYLGDSEVQAIAATGGVVGLWPLRSRGLGMADLNDFGRHAAYLCDLVGARHVCIGTDMNGVTGLMDGFAGEQDFHKLTDALVAAGLPDDDVRAVLGENFLRVFEAVAG